MSANQKWKYVVDKSTLLEFREHCSNEPIPAKEKVLTYMKIFKPSAFTSAPVYDLFTGEKVCDANNGFTDGLYRWYVGGIYHFEKYNLKLNDDFISYVLSGQTVLDKFLQADKYVDYHSENIQQKAAELFSLDMSDVERARVAYEFVRDEIPHSFDCNAQVVTAKASDVLKYKTGICLAKANLLAALLRSQGIPTGFCFQRLTLLNDDSLGYCVHGFNAVFVNRKWIKLDARGNKPGVNAQFSLDEPILAYPIRAEYDEYLWKGIYSTQNSACMEMLEQAKSIQDIMDNIPDEINEFPDIAEY